MVVRKLLICPWFGELPSWWSKYESQLPPLRKQGYDMLLDFDLLAFKQRVKRALGVDCPIEEGSSKIHDYRACFGVLYADEIKAYDWWGHTDFDCVYGRLDRFVTDDKLAEVDVYTDCSYNYISGPFSLYRNYNKVNELFCSQPDWEQILGNPVVTGWVETSFTDLAKEHLMLGIDMNHGFSEPNLLARDDGVLTHRGEEIAYYHFNRSKEWPL